MTSIAQDARPALESRAAVPAVQRSRMTPGRWVVWALLVCGALVMAFPVYWILVTAVTPGGQSARGVCASAAGAHMAVPSSTAAKIFMSRPLDTEHRPIGVERRGLPKCSGGRSTHSGRG